MTSKYVSKLYTVDELNAAVSVLMDNELHNFQKQDAEAIVKALHQRGFRIVKTGDQK